MQVDGRTKIAIKNVISDYIPNPTFEVVARPGAFKDFVTGQNAEGRTLREITGKPMRSIPAFVDPAAFASKVLDGFEGWTARCCSPPWPRCSRLPT